MKISYPGARIGKTCIECGEAIRVVSAQRLQAGKTQAHIMVRCGCFAGTYRPTKAERLSLMPTRH